MLNFCHKNKTNIQKQPHTITLDYCKFVSKTKQINQTIKSIILNELVSVPRGFRTLN